ncbi:MAG: hypothetical protein QXE31_04125 [Candidatus Woesearchaeota archaeon]
MNKKKETSLLYLVGFIFLLDINIVLAQSSGQSFVRALNPFWNLISYIFKDLLQPSTRYIFFKFLVWMLLWIFLMLLAPKALESLKADNDTAKKQANIITFILALIMTIGIPNAALELIFSSYAFLGFLFIMFIGPALFIGGKTPQNNFARGGIFILIGIIIYAYDSFASNLSDIFILGATLSIIYGIIMWINGLSIGGSLTGISKKEPSNPKDPITNKEIEQEKDSELKKLKQEIKALFELNREFSKDVEVIQNNVSDLRKKNILSLKRELNLEQKKQRLNNVEAQFSVPLEKVNPIIQIIQNIKQNPKFSQLGFFDKKKPMSGFDNVVKSFIINYKILISLLRDYALYKGELLSEKEENLHNILKEHIDKLKKTFEIVGKTADSETLKLEAQINNLENEIVAAIQKGKKQKKEKLLKLISDLENDFNNMDTELKNYGSLIDSEIKKINEYINADDLRKNQIISEIKNNLSKFQNAFNSGLRYLRNMTRKGIKEEKKFHQKIIEIKDYANYLENDDLKIENAYNTWIAWVKEIEEELKKLDEINKKIKTINYEADLINLFKQEEQLLSKFYQSIQKSESVCKALLEGYRKLANEVQNL